MRSRTRALELDPNENKDENARTKDEKVKNDNSRARG